MVRRILGASLLAALFLATPALSEEATIGRSIEGGSLHEGHLDMVVYYVPVDDDRDSVAFSMPGYQDPLYTFSRSSEEVTVSVEADMDRRAAAATAARFRSTRSAIRKSVRKSRS